MNSYRKCVSSDYFECGNMCSLCVQCHVLGQRKYVFCDSLSVFCRMWIRRCYTDVGQNGNELSGTLYEPPSAPVDLGSFEPNAINCGNAHCCAVSTAKTAKCWGDSGYDKIGNGANNADPGNNEGEMGDNLLILDLGSGFLVDSISAGSEHTCALSTDHSIKCFGRNQEGQLGYEHTDSYSGEMGDALSIVDLGADFEPIQVECGNAVSCALSSSFQIKCWGNGEYGTLGQGNTTNIGDRNGTMGDNMAVIDLGADFSAIEIRSGDNHICALSMNDEVKCWGRNDVGQLGLEDTEN